MRVNKIESACKRQNKREIRNLQTIEKKCTVHLATSEESLMYQGFTHQSLLFIESTDICESIVKILWKSKVGTL
jgi:hypothetical protein